MRRRTADELALRMRRGEWDLVALALLLALAERARAWPGTVDDVLALLSAREEEAARGA